MRKLRLSKINNPDIKSLSTEKVYLKHLLDEWVDDGWMDGGWWMHEWVGGWVDDGWVGGGMNKVPTSHFYALVTKFSLLT